MRRTVFSLAGCALLAACGSTATGAPAATVTAAPTTAAPTIAAPATTAAPTTLAAFPVSVKTPDGTVTIPARPTHIVSLSPTATEMLYAVGAGSQVVAVDDQSNYPPEAPRTNLSGFTPNLEAILAEHPDLVVVSDATKVKAGLAAAKVPVLVQDAASRLDDTYRQLNELGQATGHTTEAERAATDLKTKVTDLAASAVKRPTPATYYYELDDTYYSVTSKTFIGSLFALAGLKSIADAADSAGTGYPQLSAEYIVEANPDLVFLADTKCCKQSAATVAARPGWSTLTAVTDGGVVALDDDIASRWGPRVVELLSSAVHAAAALPGG